MKLLALDTATDLCSAALWIDGVISAREQLAPRQHGTLILVMIDALLAEAGLGLRQLDAIAFGRGPGAFTGLRLAAATAQGLGFAAQRPLIPVSDLRALACQALASRVRAGAQSSAPQAAGSALTVPGRALICQDARMGELYWGCFERLRAGAALCPVGEEHVGTPQTVALPPQWASPPAPPSPPTPLYAAGSGFAAYASLGVSLDVSLGASIGAPLAALLPDLHPRAREVAQLAAEDGLGAAVPPEQAMPVYLRDRVTAVAPSAPT